jgi:hypothetical protein
MINEQEQKLIAKFVIKAKQDRYLAFLSKEKTRHKFTEELYHFRDFNWILFREITGSESERETVSAEVSKRKISTCYVITVNSEYDGKFVPVSEAIEDVIGTEGTILIFGHADVIYYEGEAPNRRYISI